MAIVLEECTVHSVRAGTMYHCGGHERTAWESLVGGDTRRWTHVWSSRLENMDGMKRWTHAATCRPIGCHHLHADEEAVLGAGLNLCLASSYSCPRNFVKGLETALESHIRELSAEMVLCR